MSRISLPWIAKPPEVSRGYRERAIRSLLAIGAALVVLGVILFAAFQMYSDGAMTDWRVLVAYLGVAGPIATGVAIFLGGVAIIYYRRIGALLGWGYVALLILCGAVVGTGLLVWGYSWLSGWMQTSFTGLGQRVIPAPELYEAISDTLPIPLIAYWLWPLQFELVRDLIAMGGVVGFINVAAAFGIWWERKVAGRIQSRVGPMRVGMWHGWAQSPADGIKLVFKEDLIPAGADQILFRLSPYLAFVPVVIAFIALPFAATWVFREMDVALIFILAMLGLDVLGTICAGLASDNKYSTYGAIREACQMISYEIPMGMSLLVPVMLAGTLNLGGIAGMQDGGFHSWLIFANPWCFAAFFLYYIGSLASCKRAPFDLPEAESELVAGFLTEFSGFRWALFFFGEYAAMFAVSGLAVILFFGGWYSPFPISWLEALGDAWYVPLVRGLFFDGPILFILKAFGLFYVQLWLRWTLPRLRIDQVLYTCVQVLLPLTMIVLLGNTLWILCVEHLRIGWLGSVDAVLHVVLVVIGYALAATILGLAAYGFVNRWRLVGKLGIKTLPGA
ncbi:MAG: NADH-quinone oxidoreductase subunit NuoH [Planctomycetota bacterium]